MLLSPRAAADDTRAAANPAPARPQAERLYVASTLEGSSGLVRVSAADSGPPGTFQLSLTESFYVGERFLCPNCELADGSIVTRSDDVALLATRLQLSFTPLSFLEGYASLRYQTTSNNQADQSVTFITGDSTLGAKAFARFGPNDLVATGGGAQLTLLTGASDIGARAANVTFSAHSTLDLTALPASPIPARAHLNVAYRFDNSSAIATEIESSRAAVLGWRQHITRFERFGYDINRIDSLSFGLGAEGVFALVRPFIEWTLDLPVNRQGYVCPMRMIGAGDHCYSRRGSFASVPSRLTLGARAYPTFTPWSEGLVLTLAADLGTGATSTFLDEVAPEVPYAVHLGIGYAFDTRPRPPVIVEKQVEVEVEAPHHAEYVVLGTVVSSGSGEPIEGARIDGAGTESVLLSNSEGRFRTAPVAPGVEREFLVQKDGFKAATCFVRVPAAAPRAKSGEQGEHRPGEIVVPLSCELVKLPSVGAIDGVVRDAETTAFVTGARVRVRDARGRSLELASNDLGAFRFENIPAGSVRLEIEADGYLPSATELALKPRDTLELRLTLHRRPKVANVLVTKSELKLKRQVHFLHDSAEILPDSQAILEEIAEVLRARPELARIEIQGHTDNVGGPDHNRELSRRRAEAVQSALVLLGVAQDRLVARGYGSDQPLVPNVSDAARGKNRRVQLMIQNP